MLFHLLDVLAHDSKIENEDTEWHMCERKKSDGSTYTIRSKNGSYLGREFQIELFGVNETGAQVHVNVTGFSPSFYVELPDSAAFEEIRTHVNRILRPK
jgi:DNA polymerase elongation subunit (family B)